MTTITGPRKRQDEDGPEEFHLVVVDNGRSKLLADPHLRESLNCLRCGACLNACPVYRKVGGHAYGWVYPGPIGAVVSPVLTGISEAKHLPFASSLCGACKEACPVKINIPRMLLKLRNEISEGDRYPEERSSPLAERLAFKGWRAAMSHPALMSAARSAAKLLQGPMSGGASGQQSGPGPMAGWTRHREAPKLADRPFSKRWRDLQDDAGDSPE